MCHRHSTKTRASRRRRLASRGLVFRRRLFVAFIGKFLAALPLRSGADRRRHIDELVTWLSLFLIS